MTEKSLKHESLKIQQILNNSSKSERKLAYSLLNEREKLILWKKKINYAIQFGSLKISQKNALNNVIEKLDQKIFVDETDENVIFRNVRVPQIINNLQKHFSNNDIGNLFYSLKYYIPTAKDNGIGVHSKDGEEQGGGGTGDDSTNCDCNRNSMFSCTWLNTLTCKEKTCKKPEIENQCGFLGMFPCNGVCKPY